MDMKNKLHNDESLLREKLRGHEFPADDQAWEQMEYLLNGAPAPFAPLAEGQPGLSASFTNHRIFSWFTVSGVGALMLFLTVSGSTNVKRTPSEAERREEMFLPVATSQNVVFEKSKKTKPSQNNNSASEGLSKSTASSVVSASGTSKGVENKLFIAKGKSVASPPLNPDRHSAAANNDADPTGSKEAHLPQEYSDQQSGDEILTTEKQASLSAVQDDLPPTVQNSTIAIVPLPAVGFQSLQGTPVAPRISAIVQPRKVFRERRTQVGVALGGQLALVNRRENVVDLLPAFGLSITHQFNPNWSVQADLMYKKVHGYDLEASFSDQGFSALGNYNSWSIWRTAQELTFLEMPILLKRRLQSGKQAVFAGVRPALVRAVSGEGSSSYFNNSQNKSFEAFTSIQNGIRRFDLAFTIGCEARLWKNLWIDIRHSQGVFDLTYDNYFNNSYTDTTSDTQLTLRYYFWAF